MDSLGNTASVNVSVGGGIAINPASPSTPPKGSVAFSVQGGSGTGFVWSLAQNASGGTINATGTYTAGTTGSVSDTVKVTDSLNNTASVAVTVTATVSITPSTASVVVGASKTFSAGGGSGKGYAWSLATNSGGNITTGGVYTAGSTSGVDDTVQLVDSLGNSATALVAVTSITPSDGGSPADSGTDGAIPDGGGVSDGGTGGWSSSGCGCATVGDIDSRYDGFLSIAVVLMFLRRRARRRQSVVS